VSAVDSFGDWRKHRAEKRVKPGDGRPLAPYRWWQLLSRSVFFLRLPESPNEYAIDVRTSGDRDDGTVRARLYRNQVQSAVSKVPARFPVEGGVIEVETTMFGVRRAHYVTTDGAETQLTPHPRSGEGRRANLHRQHPVLSRVIAVVATIIVIVGIAITLLQLAESLSNIPPIANSIGVFVSPIRLPFWANIGVILLIASASVERALRMRSSWIDALAT
jgi:hypothetical protein